MTDSKNSNEKKESSDSRKKKQPAKPVASSNSESGWDSFMKDAVVFNENNTASANDIAVSFESQQEVELLKGHDMDRIIGGLIKKHENDPMCVNLLTAIKKDLDHETQMMKHSFSDFYNRNPDLVDRVVRELEKHEWRVLMDMMQFAEVMLLGVKTDLMKERIFFGEKPYYLERIQQSQSEDEMKALEQMNEACMVLKDGYLKELFDDAELFGRRGLLTVIAGMMGKAAFIEKTRPWVDRLNQAPQVTGAMTMQLQGRLAEFHRVQPRIVMFQGQYLSLVCAM